MIEFTSLATCIFIGILTLVFYIAYNSLPKGVNWIRYIKARLWLRTYNQKFEKQVIYKRIKEKNITPFDVGLIPSVHEYKIEKPRPGLFEHCDGIHFSGFNLENQFLDICINRITENMASVWIFFQISKNNCYQLSNSKDTRKPYICKENGFYSSGLQIKCLVPFRKWRVSFNGLLQKVLPENEDKKCPLIHVKFSFLWHAMSVVQEQNIDFIAKDVAKALAGTTYEFSESNLERYHKLQNRFEQCGQFMGTVLINDKHEEMYLWSLRTRLLDSVPNEEFQSTKLFMYFEDGMPLKIENLTVGNILTNLTSGYTIDGHGAAKEINQFEFSSALLKAKSSVASISFKNFRLEKNKKKKMVIEITDEIETFNFGINLEKAVTLKYYKVSLDNDVKGVGMMFLMETLKSKEENSFAMPPILLKDLGIKYPLPLAISLNNEKCRSSLLAGGKGCSLSLLTSLSKLTTMFEVPEGFVITTFAFDQYLQNNPSLNFAIQRVVNVSCGKFAGNLKEECVKCAAEFQKSSLSENLKSTIQTMIDRMYGNLVSSLRFSIRSSACDEDSEEFSAAGQMLTILGVHGIENIFKSIIECWSSKFGFEAVQYAKQNGLLIKSSMAVVVQEMVPSEVSGVLFTVDPVTGDPAHPYITANYGLGETVVSSLAEPDTIVLKREQGSVEIESKTIGTKQTQVHMKDENGTEQKTFNDEILTVCLSDDQAIKIGTVGLLVESCFCLPQDIEWAFYKNKLYLLQARPITTMHTETEFETIHDQDTPIRSNEEFWTRANVGEVYSGATSPLGISLTVGILNVYGLRNQIQRELFSIKDYCPYFYHTIPITHRQVTLNLLHVLFRANEKKISNYQKAFEVSLFGREIGTEKMHQVGVKKYGYRSFAQRLIGFPYLMLFSYLLPKRGKECEDKIKKFDLSIESFTTIIQTWDEILRQIKFVEEVARVHGLTTFLSSFYNLWVLTILAKKKKKWDTELYCDFSTLLSVCSSVESADVPESLQELAKIIAKHHGSTFSSLPTNMALSALENDCGLPGVLFKEFIRKHGHRCIKEFDISSVPWEMNPESLVSILQTMVNSPNIFKHQPQEEIDINFEISSLKTSVSGFYKKILKIVLPWSRNAVRQREKSKSMLIKTINWHRKTVLHLGELMAFEGMLPSKDLIFFLTLEEINEMIQERKPGLVSKAIRRRKIHPKLDNLQFPEIINGIPKPINDIQDISIASNEYSEVTVVKGTPVSQGKVLATARIVKSFEEVSSIQNGDILITYSTDVGWTPYFPLLSGVVTVLGGLISHGAVVAREYGLPCIVGAQDVMSVFKSGDIVLLDGTKGTITKVDKTNPKDE